MMYDRQQATAAAAPGAPTLRNGADLLGWLATTSRDGCEDGGEDGGDIPGMLDGPSV
eukprot:COSAG01_NODE_8258_length_2854_cov_8.360436_3_plen_57_part_00